MDIQKERESFQKFCEENFDFERHEQTYFDEQTQCYENDIGEDTESINMAWATWQAATAQAVPEGFVVVSQKDLLELTIAINAVDLATHTESKTNEVREMWQQIALKLMALGISQEQSHECQNP